MKKEFLIENPLFENLLKKAEKYQPLYKTLNEQESQEAGKKDTVDKPKEEKKRKYIVTGKQIGRAHV